MFYDQFIKLCKVKGVKPTPLVISMGLSSSNVSQWKKGSTPRPDVLQRLADYFNVSVGVLLGYEQIEKPTLDSESGLSEMQTIFAQLTEDNQAKLIELSRLYLDAQSKSGESK